MSVFSGYLLGIVGVVILTVLVDLVLPDSKISKYIKSIMAIFVIAVIISPISDLLRNGFDSNSLVIDSEYAINQDILENLNEQNKNYMEDNIERSLAGLGYSGCDVMISMDSKDSEILYLYVNLCDLVIKENEQHIDYHTKIKELIKNLVNVEEEQIILYG